MILGVLTLLFWRRGRSRESVLALEGKLAEGTIIEDRFKTTPLLRQVGHIFSRFNLVLMILNSWFHNSVLQAFSSQMVEIYNTFGISSVHLTLFYH